MLENKVKGCLGVRFVFISNFLYTYKTNNEGFINFLIKKLKTIAKINKFI